MSHWPPSPQDSPASRPAAPRPTPGHRRTACGTTVTTPTLRRWRQRCAPLQRCGSGVAFCAGRHTLELGPTEASLHAEIGEIARRAVWPSSSPSDRGPATSRRRRSGSARTTEAACYRGAGSAGCRRGHSARHLDSAPKGSRDGPASVLDRLRVLLQDHCGLPPTSRCTRLHAVPTFTPFHSRALRF